MNKFPTVIIKEGLLDNPSLFYDVFKKNNQQVMIITDDIIAPLYLSRLTETLEKIPSLKQINHFIIKHGDAHKNLETAQRIFTYLIEQYHYRDTTLIALGGGMVGDLTGFCAACYLRGVAFIQMPTTLLAQVDAAIGGKTAINHPLGKNLIGAFYQPTTVMCDLSLLHSLSQREFIAGLAEGIKYGLALDADFFDWIEKNIVSILDRKVQVMDYMVRHCIQIKTDIVSKDEKEQGERVLLNFGHTLGHALEAVLNFKVLSHGEAVSIGLLAAVALSERICKLDSAIFIRLKKLLTLIGLPVQIPEHITVDQLISAMIMDKKNKKDSMRWVLLTRLGHAKLIDNIPHETVHEVLMNLGAQR